MNRGLGLGAGAWAWAWGVGAVATQATNLRYVVVVRGTCPRAEWDGYLVGKPNHGPCPRPPLQVCAASATMFARLALSAWLATFYEMHFQLKPSEYSVPLGLIVVFCGSSSAVLGGALADRLAHRLSAATAATAATKLRHHQSTTTNHHHESRPSPKVRAHPFRQRCNVLFSLHVLLPPGRLRSRRVQGYICAVSQLAPVPFWVLAFRAETRAASFGALAVGASLRFAVCNPRGTASVFGHGCAS